MKDSKSVLIEFGEHIKNICTNELAIIARARVENPWFTEQMVSFASKNWGECLSASSVDNWLKDSNDIEYSAKKVGIIMAGNIPFVGLHDLLSVLVSGHKAICKLSSQDTPLMKWCIYTLYEIEPKLKNRISIAEDRLDKVDALIATGSDNSSRYFEYYFKDIPRIIRKNRSSVAVIDSDILPLEIEQLADDIFRYYGLGCRNVGKIHLPEGYDITKIIDGLEKYKDIIHHHKYANNYTYHKAILLMNLDKHLDNGFAIFQEKNDLIKPPLSTLFFSFYKDKDSLVDELMRNSNIQCIVGKGEGLVPFGEAQNPGLSNYADNVNTLEFLGSI